MTKRSAKATKPAPTPGPYRGEHGAVHDDRIGPGFVFTTSPPAFAPDVAHALNTVEAMRWRPLTPEASPEGPFLARSSTAPFGARGGPEGQHTIHIAQRGNGGTPGLWVANAFYPDAPKDGLPGSKEFQEWAPIPE